MEHRRNSVSSFKYSQLARCRNIQEGGTSQTCRSAGVSLPLLLLGLMSQSLIFYYCYCSDTC